MEKRGSSEQGDDGKRGKVMHYGLTQWRPNVTAAAAVTWPERQTKCSVVCDPFTLRIVNYK